MIKAVIFDMFETLITHFESPLYMGKQIACDMGIAELKFREIWDTTDDDRTLGNKSLEEVIEEILRVNNRYSTELFEKIIAKRKMSKIECFKHIHPEIPREQTVHIRHRQRRTLDSTGTEALDHHQRPFSFAKGDAVHAPPR